MLWRSFFCSSVSTFTISFWSQVTDDGWTDLELNATGTLKFGTLTDISVPLSHIWGAVVLGIMGGIFGSLFTNIGTWMSFYRKYYITTDLRKIIEAGMMGAATISVMTSLVIFMGECEA